MDSLGFKQRQGHHNLFIKRFITGKFPILLVCVDHMIIAENDKIEKLVLKKRLAAQVELKDLGELKYFLM